MQTPKPAMLSRAVLTYGSSAYPVTHKALPAAFDFDHAEACARRILAVMSNASGGHTLRDCRLWLDPAKATANLVANGAHVFYSIPDRPKLLDADAVQAHILSRQCLYLGDVSAQYLDCPVWRMPGPNPESRKR